MGVRSLRSSFWLSVLVHSLLAVLGVVLLKREPLRPDPRRITWVEVDPVRAAKPRNIEEPPKRLKKPRDDSSRQIVQTTRGTKVDQVPVDAFLGERNQVVDRQTVSSQSKTVIGREQEARKKAPVKTLTLPADDRPDSRRGALANLGMAIVPPVKKGAQEIQDLDMPDWAPTEAQAPQDYVRGLTHGQRTALNTREFAFYGYYQRIRERLDRAWVPILREKLVRYYRTGRQLASDTDYSTRVVVVLNQGGEIVRVQLLNESGARDLDEAAVKAFNRAGPFPNPPRGIVDPNGEIQIPWEFVLRT